MKRHIFKHNGAADHPAVASTLHSLGVLYYDLGNYAGSRGQPHQAKLYYNSSTSMYTQSLQMKKRIYGADDHHSIADALQSLSSTYQELGMYDTALEHLTSALDIKQRVYMGKDHPSIAYTLHCLGDLYHVIGNVKRAVEPHDLALDFYARSIDMKKRIYAGPHADHPLIAYSMHNMGATCHDVGNVRRSPEHYE